jgi:hypothetical protein
MLSAKVGLRDCTFITKTMKVSLDEIFVTVLLTSSKQISFSASVHFRCDRSEADSRSPGRVQGRNRRRRNHGPQRRQRGKQRLCICHNERTV